MESGREIPRSFSCTRKFPADAHPVPVQMTVAAEAEQMEEDAPKRRSNKQAHASVRRRLQRSSFLPTDDVEPAVAACLLIALSLCSHFRNEELLRQLSCHAGVRGTDAAENTDPKQAAREIGFREHLQYLARHGRAGNRAAEE
jgi:hypothetical protein